MKHCNQIKHTCGTTTYATCVTYETPVPEFSELGECVDIEQTTTELYELVGDIRNQIDLSALGEECLEYVETEEGKIIVKNVLLKFEAEICDLKTKVETLENRQLCDFPIADCDLDLDCLALPCDTSITTWAHVIQALINKSCE